MSGVELAYRFVVISGHVGVASGDLAWADVGRRASPFEDIAPHAVYLPPGRDVRISAANDAEIALCSAPATTGVAPRHIKPAAIRRTVRGQGTNTRYVRDILPQAIDRLDTLLENPGEIRGVPTGFTLLD